MKIAISIHAPPRGATYVEAPAMPGQRISIHAPPRGATTKHSKIRLQRTHFNSRPSARGDQRVNSSIKFFDYFNSRPSARGDRGK